MSFFASSDTPKIVALATLRARAKNRLPGYVEECLRVGRLDEAGERVSFARKDWYALSRQFNGRHATASKPGCC